MRTFNSGGNSHLTRDDAATQSRIALNLAAGGGVRMTSGAAIGVVQAPSGVSRAQPTQSTDRVFQGRHRVDAAERLINVAEALLFSMKNVSPHKNLITQCRPVPSASALIPADSKHRPGPGDGAIRDGDPPSVNGET